MPARFVKLAARIEVQHANDGRIELHGEPVQYVHGGECFPRVVRIGHKIGHAVE